MRRDGDVSVSTNVEQTPTPIEFAEILRVKKINQIQSEATKAMFLNEKSVSEFNFVHRGAMNLLAPNRR